MNKSTSSSAAAISNNNPNNNNNNQSHNKRMQQISTEGETLLGRQDDPLGNVQEISIRPYKKWYMHNPAPVLESDRHKLLWVFDIQTDQLILARRADLIIINNKKREFAKL